MSKRFFPQQMGDRKRARLDISMSDHNFPLSQNKESKQEDTWGDDNDDEILLLASQACEEAYNANDISLLPDYSMCMQPGSTSTQMYSFPGPSTSKSEFTFKKPSANTPSAISTNLREKCNRIASPLPGITANVMPKANEPGNVSDDLIFNDNMYKGQGSDYIYRQLLQLQEENAKLKSENGKLLEKCVTKEGETSILRTQLKTCQVSVDNARLEKIKAQEKVQMEWSEKLTAANSQMHDLRNQLDFKNLEIISIKEKCKKLESNKVKLTQVTVGHNDISSSYRPNSTFLHNDSMTHDIRKVKTSSNAVQTEDKAHLIALNKTCRKASSPLHSLLPLLLQPTTPPHSILDYNEKLSHTDVPYKCRAYSTLHREPTMPAPVQKDGRNQMAAVYEDVVKIANGNGDMEIYFNKDGRNQMAAVYEDVVKIANGNGDREIYINVFNAVKSVLTDVENRLVAISQRMTTAFQREMDEKYIETTSSFIDICREDLLKGCPLYKEEQEILARRMAATLSYVLESSGGADFFHYYERTSDNKGHFTECVLRICSLIDSTSTATLHSGLLLAIFHMVQGYRIANNLDIIRTIIALPPKTLDIIRTIISSRPMSLVSIQLLELVKENSLLEPFRKVLCPGISVGNLKMDYDQGVLLYKKENCHLQILLRQIEAGLKCIENQDLTERAVETARQLILLYCNLQMVVLEPDKPRCECQLVAVQVIVYALRICAVMLQNTLIESNDTNCNSLVSLCRCGAQIFYKCWAHAPEFISQLAHYEGYLIQFCEILRETPHTDIYANMLSELAGSLQSSPEDMPPSYHRQPWLKSFESFSMAD